MESNCGYAILMWQSTTYETSCKILLHIVKINHNKIEQTDDNVIILINIIVG